MTTTYEGVREKGMEAQISRRGIRDPYLEEVGKYSNTSEQGEESVGSDRESRR